MINNYPFFGFPNYLNHKQPLQNPYIPNNLEYKISKPVNTNSEQYKNKDKKIIPNTFLNILGINLSFDDVLIICVILFLYNEKTDDYYLLFVLILLLLS